MLSLFVNASQHVSPRLSISKGSAYLINSKNSYDSLYPAGPPACNDLLVPQAYIVDVSLSNVIKGNSALLKCNIPSFVADFVQVSSWVTDKGHTFLPSDNYVKIM
ncbi:hypothetical protein Anas_07288 [Armadillidium nasatum]|uniref:Down syndrome cell adhesion molecule-like protein Dscam2 n=1 Tax=Armadillidium nasatum TaxID=96803 RepID=A0A5N5SLM6_9CRUS|nr:hypothetical protein Anas_07288 [Armadillidium nasatum]